jgi:hypothetical protein
MKIFLRLYNIRGRGFPSTCAGEGRGGGCIFTVKVRLESEVVGRVKVISTKGDI